MADVRDQLRGLGDDDEALADELTAQLVKLGKQKTTLRGTLVATNPRRRRMLTDRPGYRTALRSWIKVLRSAPVGASGVKRETRSRRRRR